jgi:hypothetical protein
MTAKVSSLFTYFFHPGPIKNGRTAEQRWPPHSEKSSFSDFRNFFDPVNHSWPILLYFSLSGNKMRLILLFFSSRFDKNWPIYNIFNILSFLLRSSTYSYITHIRLLYMEYIKLFANYWLFSPQSKNCDTHEGSTLWDPLMCVTSIITRYKISPLLLHNFLFFQHIFFCQSASVNHQDIWFNYTT